MSRNPEPSRCWPVAFGFQFLRHETRQADCAQNSILWKMGVPHRFQDGCTIRSEICTSVYYLSTHRKRTQIDINWSPSARKSSSAITGTKLALTTSKRV